LVGSGPVLHVNGVLRWRALPADGFDDQMAAVAFRCGTTACSPLPGWRFGLRQGL
jgi:hypothetical protein